jgi:site-specific recombinase XerD
MRTNKLNSEIVAQFLQRLNYKHELVCRVGLATGLRISDILRLTINQVKIEKPTIKEKKTGKSKRIYIPKKLREELKQFHARTSHNEYIFYSESESGHISRQAVWKDFKKASENLHIKGNIAPHSTRKSYACKLLMKGKNYTYIKDKLNHSNITDTLLYVLDLLNEKE